MPINPFADATHQFSGWSGKLAHPNSPAGGGGPGYRRAPIPTGIDADKLRAQNGWNPWAPAAKFGTGPLPTVLQNPAIQQTLLQNWYNSPPAQKSVWQITDIKSTTVSFDPTGLISTRDETLGVLKVGFDVEGSRFTISVAKPGYSFTVAGWGVGAGAGAGLDLPGVGLVGVSGDIPNVSLPHGATIVQAIDVAAHLIPGLFPISTIFTVFRLVSVLPGWYSPVYLFPNITDNDGADLFEGNADVFGLGVGAGAEFSVSLIVFWDTKRGKKAFAYTAGFDFLSSASAGGNVLHYVLKASKFIAT